jgi:hypothetical protein
LSGAVAVMLAGAMPRSTQSTKAEKGENALVAGPPLQCPMPGTRNSRANPAASPRSRRSTASYQRIVSFAENRHAVGQAVPKDHLAAAPPEGGPVRRIRAHELHRGLGVDARPSVNLRRVAVEIEAEDVGRQLVDRDRLRRRDEDQGQRAAAARALIALFAKGCPGSAGVPRSQTRHALDALMPASHGRVA